MKTMGIYHNDTIKTYPDLNPTAPQELEAYRLKNITEIEAYLLDEIYVREWPAKNMKWFNTIANIVDTSFITSTVITGGVSTATFASCVDLRVGVALNETIILFSLATTITRKSFKIFTIKQEKHDTVKLFAQAI